MTNRRGQRPTHVRPRPPSSGRPAPTPVRPRSPAPGRVSVRTPVRRGNGIPLIGRLALVVAVLVLAAVVLYVGAGGIARVADAVGDTLGSFMEEVTASPTPAPTILTVSAAPSLASPDEPYTNLDSVDLVVSVPKAVAGDPDHRIRVYLALEGQEPAPIDEWPTAAQGRSIIPVLLTDGINDFSVTLVGPAGESEPSAVVRYVLDTKPPGIILAAPRDGATLNRKAVDLEGRSQARSTLIARNLTTGDSIAGTADANGRFVLSLPIAMGGNRIAIGATDPAGNANQLELRITRGSGALRAVLGVSSYSVRLATLPEPIRLAVTVDDPDGKPLEGALVTFTLSIPGIQTVTADGVTDANGRAEFQTTIPAGADVGTGTAAVLVRTGEYGTATDDTTVKIVK